MDAQIGELSQHLVQKLQGLPQDERYLLAVCGIPGSGKTSLAKHVVDSVNHTLKQSASPTDELPATLVGMDGWHLTRKQLDEMPDPKHARDRRGAAFTFDGKAFSDFVLSLRRKPVSLITAPSFSHSEKDPVEGSIEVQPWHKLVVLEGLYCNVDEEPWLTAAKTFDERWIVTVDRAAAKERLCLRHVLTGVAKDEEEALWRVENNDLANGDWLLSKVLEPARRIPSLLDENWAGRG